MIKTEPIKTIMKIPAITVKIDEPLSHVETKLRIKGIRHLPVVDENNKVVGLITQRDLYRTSAPRRTLEGESYYDPQVLDTFILKYIMTPNPSTLTAENTIAEAITIMAAGRYGCIPIVDKDHRISGIITEIDILKYIAKKLKEEN